MARNWTERQREAFEARGGSVLVSAAAGSGKTAVLVERVILRIADESNPCPANSLLIVTFTKAAAGEMRERIALALEEKIKENPNSSYLAQQQMLLPDAQICTIDSFCNSLVKENFHLLDVSPDFQIIDGSRHSIFVAKALETVMEENYRKNDPAFINLMETFFSNRDDSAFTNCVVQLYNHSRAYPFPEKWLDSVADNYDPNIEFKDNPWVKKLTDYVLSAAEYCLELNSQMEELYSEDEVLTKAYANACSEDRALILSFKEKLENGLWNEAVSAVSKRFATRGKLPKDVKEDPVAIQLEEKRGIIKKIVKDRIIKYMAISEEENNSDMNYLFPLIKKLVECTKEFSQELFKLKHEINAYDFSDIGQMAFSLLVKETDDGYEKTDFAKELSERYVEILIDEYQDTNEQQNMFFEALSDNKNNLFRVGDVKQSIYSFRQAMPEIFINLRESLDTYKDNNYPSKIILDQNFRSRKEVTQYINFLFSQLMSKKASKIDYDENEELVPGADYYEKTEIPKAHLHLVDVSSDNFEGMDNIQCQAKYIAGLIKDMIAEERPVQSKNGLRPVMYKDFCILLRSVKKAGKVFADELRKWGIPCYTEVKGNFFSSTEVEVMLSLLRIIDNPVQDIPLLSVLNSPLFSFTHDEIATLRINKRQGNLYSCLVAAENENKKVADFLLFLRKMRYIASTSTAGDLIRRIYEETAFPAICQAIDGEGEMRKANLMLLAEYAVTYEKTGSIGVSGFIRFIDKLAENKDELDASNPISENADVVRIMTVHKSKGLEFPVCFLANTNSRFNAEDEKKSLVINSELGVGLIRRDTNTLADYETIPHSTAKLLKNISSKEEEMRILYVALTRAKEDLFIISGVKNLYKAIPKLACDIDTKKQRIAPFSVLSQDNYSNWIIKAALRHPDCEELRKIAGVDSSPVNKSDFKLDFKIIDNVRDYRETKATISCDEKVDENFLEFVKSRTEYRYPYSGLMGIPTKVAASKMDVTALDRENFASSKPDFLNEKEELTGAQKGTATHKAMQYIDYEAAKIDLEKEIERLVCENIFSDKEAECLERNKLKYFLDSSLVNRILNSEEVYKEKKFTVSIPVEKAYPQIEDGFGETVMIQGIVDCAFIENGEMIIVDYKTDKINDEERLKEIYKEQIQTYKYAMEIVTGYKVKSLYLYSFYMSKAVEIDD